MLAIFLSLVSAASVLDGQVTPQEPPPAPGQNEPFPPKLPEVPISDVSSGMPLLLQRSSATVTVITGGDLNTLGVWTFTDALRIIPGLEVVKSSSTESGVSVRSYTASTSESQGILGLVDGRQVVNEFFGGVLWENLPVSLHEIKRIEVIRGPGSFLYGPNAMYGVVNIVTMSPMDYFVDENGRDLENAHALFFRGGAGSYGSDSESLVYVGRDGDTAVKVKVARQEIDEFVTSDRRARDKSFFEARLETRFDRDQRLEFTAGAGTQRFDVLIPRFSIASGLTLDSAVFDAQAEECYAKADYSLGGLRLQATWTRFDASARPDRIYSAFDLLLDTADVDLQYSFTPLDDHALTVGAGYRYSTFVMDPVVFSDGRHDAGLGWFFVQDQVALSRNLFLTGGVRIDDHSVAGLSTSPRLALVWEFMKEQSLRATAGSGFQDPSLRDLWLDMPVNTPLGPARIVGNRDLKPTRFRSFEIGYWGRPTDRLQTECSVYYNEGDRIFEFVLDPSTATMARDNVNKDEAYGAELNVEFQLSHDIYTFAQYSYGILKDAETHVRIPGGPRNKASGGVRVAPKDSLSAMVWANFFDESALTDRSTGDSLGRVPSYTLVNGRIWYPFKSGNADGKVFLQGFNLLDKVHQETSQGDPYGLIAMAGLEIAW